MRWPRQPSGCSRPRPSVWAARSGPARCGTLYDVEYATMEWVDWYNNRRLHSVLDYAPPEEYESAYYAHLRTSQPAMSQT
ncbi:integrase core domain-containing protein [Mycobacterium intermedium]|uniref:integrase core domain-containing protein n=1 Tax=Mycobacterium intermedium TaxID=28445 RepID=UPI00111C0036